MAQLGTPHEKRIPDWAIYRNATPHDPEDPDWVAWWRAVVEVAALDGEDLGVIILEGEDIENEARWARFLA